MLQIAQFWGAVVKLRKTTICFLMSGRPPVCIEQLGSHWTDFHEIWDFSIFRKYFENIQISLKSGKNSGYFTWRPTQSFGHILLGSS